MSTGEELFVNQRDEEMPDIVEEDDDPVVSETPVYFAGTVGNGLSLLQFPTRKAGLAGAKHPVCGFRLKPESQVVETDVAVDMPSEFRNDLHPSHGQENQTYGGILKSGIGNYAVGHLSEDGSLHLALVSRSGQLRPSFGGDDQGEKKFGATLANPPPNPAQIRSVNLSVKSTTEQTAKYSGVLDFWKKAALEEFKTYDFMNPEEPTAYIESVSTDDIPVHASF